MLVLLVIIHFLPVPALATIYYVDAENGDDDADGLSWSTATHSITAVFQKDPQQGDQIRVAEGRYPEHVIMADGVLLSGGFAHGGTEPDPDVYVSVIDGEFVHRCVTGADNAVLEGFTIENGSSPNGAGVLHTGITMQVRSCNIRNCTATAGNPNGGGAMHFYQSRSIIQNCVFESNVVDQSPDDTSGEIAGGAVMGWAAGPEFHGCIFRSNSVLESPTGAIRLGGAMWFAASDPMIRGCLFENNSAETGGGAGWWNRSRPTLEDCTFRNNTADAFGGGVCHIYNEVDEPEIRVVVRNCRFEANTADSGAGMAVMRHNDVLIDNCLFVRNSAVTAGCGVLVEHFSRCAIQHCTISDNQQTAPGETSGCIEIDDTSWVTIRHSIVSANESYFGIRLENGGDPLNHEISSCDIHGHYRNYSENLVDRTGWCGNISEHPIFTYFADEPYCLSEPSTLDPLQIQLGRSPCIDRAFYSVTGYPAAYGTTRTDHIPDRQQADMGFHLNAGGPRMVMDNPDAGDYAVDTDTIIRFRLMDTANETTADDLHVTLNALPVEPDVSDIPGGFELVLEPTGGLSPNTDYWLSVTIDMEPEDIIRELMFSTADPPPPHTPPTGSTLNINFPMTDSVFHTGDFLDISATIYNAWLNPVAGDVHIAFLYAQNVFIFPDWDQAIHPIELVMTPGESLDIDILAFEVPPGIGNLGPFDFFAIITQPGSFDLISPVASWSMFFQEP